MPKHRQEPPASAAARGPGRLHSRSGAVQNVQVAGVVLSNPQRVLFPQQGVTKSDLARYFEDVGEWLLPLLRNRPLSLLRCPEGRSRQCFFQKHPGVAVPEEVPRIPIREKHGKADYLYVGEIAHVVALVQIGVLELHVWGSRVEDLERPDILVFDLDPGEDVEWRALIRTARDLRDRLEALGLIPFLRTTGGKGLHLVVPVEPRLDWDSAKSFTRSIAKRHAADDPTRFTTNASRRQRHGRVFLDYLRNTRGATAIACYSTRARAGCPVAVPVRWDELRPELTGDRYSLSSVRRRLGSLRGDPWEGFDDARRRITRSMLAAVAVG